MRRLGMAVLFIVLILVALTFLGNDDEVVEEEPIKEVEPIKEEEPAQEVSDEDKIKTIVGSNEVIKYYSTEDVINNGQIITLEVNGENNGKIRLLTDSADIFEKLFKEEEVTEVNLLWYANLVDKYGNTESEKVLRIILKEETADKINWKDFNVNHFKDIADQYWEHKVYED